MAVRLFGTDGVRGHVGTDLTAEIAFKLGRAAAGYFLERGVARCLLARDTRVSGPMIAAAFLAGASSAGTESTDIGIAPTPAVSVLLSGPDSSHASFGVVISASHNPYPDNGIKIFAPEGRKLTIAEEEAIERRFRTTNEVEASDQTVGRILRDETAARAYIDALRSRFQISSSAPKLKKTRLVIDAAHGSFAPHVRHLFAGLAPEIIYLNDDFTGTDINAACGSTHLESLDPHLSPLTADRSSSPSSVGLAFDGDGDRMLIRIPPGRTIEGDAMKFLFAKHIVTSGPVVGTVMSNGCLAAAIESMGRKLLRAPVGDREVYEMMKSNGSLLGGEQSGHILFGEFQHTGDGAVTALMFLKVLAENYAESIDALVRDIPAPFPQKLVNLRVAEKRPWESDPELSKAVRAAESALGPHGRLIIRYSGTEPLLRLMAESPSAKDVDEQLAVLENTFRAGLA